MSSRLQRLYDILKRDVHEPLDISEGLNQISMAVSEDIEIQAVIDSYFYHDVWQSETLPDKYNIGSSIAVLDFEFGDSNALDEYLNEIGYDSTETSRMKTKLQNIRDAVNLMRQQQSETQLLSVNFVKNVHATLMKNLGDQDAPGEFRTGRAKPSGSAFEYHLPHLIAPRLEHLLKFVNEQLAVGLPQNDRVILSCLFFSEFLLIHPFRNGNGRTARILLSMFLVPPIPITMDGSSRKEYLETLEARVYGHPPVQLTEYIIKAARRAVANLVFLVTE